MTKQTLRRERRRKFEEELKASQLHHYARLWLEFNGHTPEYVETALGTCREKLANCLADAAESRTERKTDETKGEYHPKMLGIYAAADRKVDAILDLEKQSRQAEESGQAYRGREFLVGSEYLTYGDWWHKKTGLHMYGAKAKAKVSPDWLKAFREWADNELTVKSLEAAFEANKWRGVISTPVVLTKDAIAIQAVPVVETSQAKLDENGIPETY